MKREIYKNMYMFAPKHVQASDQTCTCLEEDNLLFFLNSG